MSSGLTPAVPQGSTALAYRFLEPMDSCSSLARCRSIFASHATKPNGARFQQGLSLKHGQSPLHPRTRLLSLSGSLSEPHVSFRSITCSWSLVLVTFSRGLPPIQLTLGACRVKLGVIRFLPFSLWAWCPSVLGDTGRMQSTTCWWEWQAFLQPPTCVHTAGLLPSGGSEPQIHPAIATPYAILENVGTWLSNVSRHVHRSCVQ